MNVPVAERLTPETAYQAIAWDRNKFRYLRVGWCHTCAAQAAWGHQLGFRRVRPPCEACRGLPTGGVGTRAARWAAGLVVAVPDDRLDR
jgi:hypothetical protein